jgi:hypothetical protein
MGNQTSNLKLDHEKVLKKTINDIAAKYILTQNFQDLIGLREPENCNDLVILTSEVINQSLNWRSIIFLDQYLKKGKPINKLTKESLLYLDKNDLNNLDVENGTEKKRMCIGISKFYIKINMLFAAIATTIRPIVTILDEVEAKEKRKEEMERQREINESEDNIDKEESENEENEDAKIELENKDLLLGNEPISISLSSHSLCGKRILALINQNNYDPSKKSYTINPNLCSFFREEEGKNLYQEPGIPELEALYKDNFDYQTGQFISSLSNEAKKEYQEAINLLYKAFTGKPNTTSSFSDLPLATRFSDISLQSYDVGNKCDEEGAFTQIFKGSAPIFREYIARIQNMINNNKKINLKLVEILKQVFKIDKSEYPIIVTIDPNLTEAKLDLLIKQARTIILNLYITCEKDFLSVLEIYNELITSKTIKSVGFNKSQSKGSTSVLSEKEAIEGLNPSYLESAASSLVKKITENNNEVDNDEEKSAELSTKIPPEESTSTPEEAPEQAPEEASQEVPEEAPEEASQEVPEEAPEEAPEEEPEQVPEEEPRQEPEQTSEEVSEHVAEQTPEEVSEEVPEESAEQKGQEEEREEGEHKIKSKNDSEEFGNFIGDIKNDFLSKSQKVGGKKKVSRKKLLFKDLRKLSRSKKNR